MAARGGYTGRPLQFNCLGCQQPLPPNVAGRCPRCAEGARRTTTVVHGCHRCATEGAGHEGGHLQPLQ